MKIRSLLLLLTAMSGFLFADTAPAATVGTVNYNSPTVAIMGSGNPDGGWTSATAPNAVAEVRFKERFVSNIGSTVGTGTYTFPATGMQINFEFSIGSFNGDNLNDYTYTVSLDTDPGPGQTFISYDVFIHNDNSYGTTGFGGTPNGGGAEGTAATYAATSTMGQNSQLINWINPAFNSSIPGTYDIALTATVPNTTTVIARTEAQLVLVPEPSGIALLSLAVVGLITRRTRK